MQPLFRTQLVWVRVPANPIFGASYPFPDQPVLQGCYTVGIEAVSADLLTNTPDQTPVTANPEYYSLTLNEGSDARHQDMPVGSLISLLNGGIWKEFTPFVTDWQKSRVTFRSTVAVEEIEAVPFAVYYFTPDDLRRFDELMAKLRA